MGQPPGSQSGEGAGNVLTALYQYALSHNLSARPGFKPKNIKCYFMFSRTGDFLGFMPPGISPVSCPDIGSSANGTSKCNILVEKASIPLCMIRDAKKDRNIPTKHAFFLSALESGQTAEPLFGVALSALSNPSTLNSIRTAFEAEKYKPSDPVGLMIDGIPLEQSPNYLGWWSQFRLQFNSGSDGQARSRCLITGELAPPLATVPKVTGLYSVGGHTSGDAFLCFDKEAFQSFGLKQSANASVSEEAMTAVNAALTHLIQEATTLGGAKLVHWYNAPVQPKEDLISILTFGDDLLPEACNGEEYASTADKDAERDALAAARLLSESLTRGALPQELPARYYILPLSGASGRMMVRGWYEGSYEELYRSVSLWFDDLCLVSPYGKSRTRPPKFKALCLRMLKPGGDPKKVWERMDTELSSLINRLLHAAVTGAPLPDAVASRSLYWLRSQLLSNVNEGEQSQSPKAESLAYQLLKTWLCRIQRMTKGSAMMNPELNPAYPSTAYHCGRLMAVYAAIQADAMGGDLGSGVLQRYYASASTAPKLVIGKLSALSQHHLAKLDNPGRVIRYEQMLSEIACKIGSQPIPGALTLEQQTEFALGYYQQRAAIFAPRRSGEDTETNTEREE